MGDPSSRCKALRSEDRPHAAANLRQTLALLHRLSQLPDSTAPAMGDVQQAIELIARDIGALVSHGLTATESERLCASVLAALAAAPASTPRSPATDSANPNTGCASPGPAADRQDPWSGD